MSNVELIGSYWTLAVGADPTGEGHEWCDHDFVERVKVASDAGFNGLGMWHTDIERLLQTYTLKDIRHIFDDHGIKNIELEFLLHWFHNGEERKKSDKDRAMLLEAAEVLGARHIKIGDFFNTVVPKEQLIEEFALLCDQAAERGTKILYEILPKSFCMIDSLDKGLELTRSAGRPNGGLMFDIWHFVRNGDSNEDIIAKVTKDDLLGVELNDGFLKMPEDLYDATVHRRMLVGEGEFDVKGFVKALEAVGYTGPYGVEVLSEKLRNSDLAEVAKAAYDTTMTAFQ